MPKYKCTNKNCVDYDIIKTEINITAKIIGLIICIIMCFIAKKTWDDEGDDLAIFITIVAIILIIAEIVCIVSFVPDITTGFVNPEYGAIKEILNVIS